MLFDFEDKITLYRQNPIDGSKTIIYENLESDIQINEGKKDTTGFNSDNSELADYFIFVKKENKNIKIGDLIEFENYFGEKEIVKVMSRDFINYENYEPFIEILTKLK